jgi:hypothetical protein
MKRQEALTRFDLTSVLRSELADFLARRRLDAARVAQQQAGDLWMRTICGRGTLVAIRVEEGEMDLDAVKTLREYLNIWISHMEPPTEDSPLRVESS